MISLGGDAVGDPMMVSSTGGRDAIDSRLFFGFVGFAGTTTGAGVIVGVLGGVMTDGARKQDVARVGTEFNGEEDRSGDFPFPEANTGEAEGETFAYFETGLCDAALVC